MPRTTRQLSSACIALLALLVSGLVVLGGATPAQAAPPRVCGGVLDSGTDKVVLLGLPATGSTGAESYEGGHLAPARASEWTDYSVEGDATTSNTIAVSFRQSGNNGPSLQFSAGQNTLGPLRLNNGGWAADGTLALPPGTLVRGEQFHFRIDVTGQQVTVHVDGMQVAQYSRPWLPASGTVGVRVSGAETGTLDNLVVRSLASGTYLYADDFDDREIGAVGATAAGWNGLSVREVCTVPDSPDDAYWIWSEGGATSVNSWTAFRTSFDVTDVAALPARVDARIAAETKYWLYLNGELVVFEGSVKRGPNRTDSYVDNVDLRPYLRSGENTLAILAVSYGKGGFAGPYSGRAGLFLESADLDLRSNDSWKALDLDAYGSMGVQPNYRLAEPNVRYDARAEVGGWDGWTSAAFDDSTWPAAVTAGNEGSSPWNVLVDNPIPLLKFDDLVTVPVTDPKVTASSSGGVTTYEMRLPVNHQLTPWVQLAAGTQAGRTVGLKTDHATVKGSGTEQAVQAEYVTKAGAQAYESLVWMNGDKLIVTAPDGAQVEEIGYRFSGYDTDFDGTFTSDDPYMDKLWTMARDTLYVTMRDSYMDCPDRERSQWWGDATNELEEAFYALDPSAAALGRKGISNVMGFRNGDLIPTQAPAASFSELPAQSLTALMSFWMFYEYSGDESVLDETYQPSVAYLRTYNMAADGLLRHDHGGTWHWHDWGSGEDGRLIDTLWYYIALESTLKSAAETGVPSADADVVWMQGRADTIRDNIDTLWVPGKGYYESTSDGRADDRANALAVYSGLAKPGQYEQIRDVLVTTKKSSPYMDKYVLEALYLMGYADDAMARMKDRYAPMVNSTEHSTLWEFFAGPEQDAAGTFNHAWTGGPLTMMSRYAAGIQQVEPGFTEFAVRPQLGTMKKVSADVHSVNGEIAVSIDASDPTTYDLAVTVPTGTVAQVHLPTAVVGDITLDGEPLDGAAGVLDVTVEDATGETIVRVSAGEHDFAAASPPATVTLAKLGTLRPGQDASGVVKVANTGNAVLETVAAELDVSGLTDPIELTGGPVPVGGSVDLPYSVSVPEGVRSGTTYDAEVQTTVTYAGQERTSTTSVSGFARVTADVAVASVVVGDRAGAYPATGQWTATATVRNDGASAVTGRVVARSVDDVLEAGAPSRLVTVPAGASVVVPVTVHGGGRHWLPIMQSVTVDFADRGSVLATGTSGTRVKWYGPQGPGWNATGAGAVQGATDFVDLGDGGSGSTGNSAANVRPGPTELAHDLQWNYDAAIPVGGTNTEGGLTRRFTWSRDGSWFSVDVAVEQGEPFVLTMRETADTSVPSTVQQVQSRPKAYQVLVDDVLVQQVKYLVPNEGVVGNTLASYQVLVDEPDALDADGDGKVTVKYLYRGGNDVFYDPSLTDVWVSPAPAAQADDRAPTVSAAPVDSTEYGRNGWITAPTEVEVTAVDDPDPDPAIEVALDDATMGAYDGPVAVDTDGNHVLRYSATDASGNTSGVQELALSVDATAPVPSFGDFPSGEIREGEVPAQPACQATDATSGVASCTITGWSTHVGPHTLTQKVVDKAGNRAVATLDYEVVAIDKSALGAALDGVSALDPAAYTTSTWAALRAVVDGPEGAQAVYDGTTFTEAQVAAATGAVKDAVAALALRGNPTALATLIAAADDVAADLGGYTDASAQALRAALADAKAVHEARDDRTQAELAAAAATLQAALDGLEAKPAAVDTTALQGLLARARALSNADGGFTAESWANLQSAIADAQVVLSQPAPTQAAVNAAVHRLTAAVAGLVPVPVVPQPVGPVPTEVTLNQARLRLAKGQAMRVEEGVYDADGGASYAGAVVWTSSNPKVATVSASGVVHAVRPGSVAITATTISPGASGKPLTARLKVKVVPRKSAVEVTRVAASVPRSMKAGTSVDVTGKYFPASATKVKVTYRSSKHGVATVDAAGRIVAVKKGTVTITVRAGGASRSYLVRVR